MLNIGRNARVQDKIIDISLPIIRGDPSTIRVQTIAGKTRKRKYTKTKGLKQQSKQEEHKSAPKSKW